MTIFTIHVAKTNLSQLLARAEAGEEIFLARGKVPVARLVPLNVPQKSRRFGSMQGKVRVDAAFFDPLPDDELKAWE